MKARVKAIINFLDVEANINRKIGEEFICEKSRAEYLQEHKGVEILEIIDEPKVEKPKEEAKPIIEKPKTTKKKTTKK